MKPVLQNMSKIRKSALLLSLFIFANLVLLILARELVNRFNGLELTYPVAIGATLGWLGIGMIISIVNTQFLDKRQGTVLSILVFLSALSGLMGAIYVFFAKPMLADGSGIEETVCFSLIAPLPFGLVTGGAMGMLGLGFESREDTRIGELWGAGGIISGLALLFLLQFFSSILVIGLSCMVMPVFAVVLVVAEKQSAKLRLGMWLMALLVIIVSFLIGTSGSLIMRICWRRINGQAVLERSIDACYSRKCFLANQQQLLLYDNGTSVLSLPYNVRTEIPRAVLVSSQVDRADLRVLLIAPPWSRLPLALSVVPNVESVDLLWGEEGVNRTLSMLKILPDSGSRFRIIDEDPVRYLESAQTPLDYDLVVVADLPWSSISYARFYRLDTLRLLQDRLTYRGTVVFALPPSQQQSALTAEEIVLSSVKSCFPKGRLLSSNPINFASGPDVTNDFTVLDDRLAKHMPEFHEFPPGLLGFVFAPMSPQTAPADIEMKQSGSTAEGPWGQPRLPFLKKMPGQSSGLVSAIFSFCVAYPWGVLVVLLAGYGALRLFLSRKQDLGSRFLVFENGLFFGYATVLTLFLYQGTAGTLSRDLPALLGVAAGGISLAVTVCRFRRQLTGPMIVLGMVGMLILFLATMAVGQLEQILLIAVLGISGVSVGASFQQEAERSLKRQTTELFAALIMGAASAFILGGIFILPTTGAYILFGFTVLARAISIRPVFLLRGSQVLL